MTELIWEQIEGEYPERNLRLRKILSSARVHATFVGEYLNSLETDREVLVWLFLEDGKNSEQRLNRFLEATFFEHPHILRNLEAGTISRGQFTFVYAVSERGDAPARRSLNEEEALNFASQIISALRYLHSKNLIHCMLSPESVVKIGTDWKLGDFSELRLSGKDEGYSTVSLASRVDTAPPEAVEGIVSPAWDVWSLGQTLRNLVKTKSEPRGLPEHATNDEAPSPDSFRRVVLACLNVKPSSRPSLDQLSSLLRSSESVKPRVPWASLSKAHRSGT
jgi:serine/threonine protein kinase